MYSVIEIELILKGCYSRKNGELAFYRRLCKTPVLVVNEIGKHKPGDWEFNFLSYIINKRYENLKPTVLITNTHLKEDCPAGECPGCFHQYMGNDVLSRIVENGIIMHFNEKDYRRIKRDKRMEGV
jgi:DNA replication protein DnaC